MSNPGQRLYQQTGSQQPGAASDAIALLKADHRHVANLFQQFNAARAVGRKWQIAERICNALLIHMTIEEEIFYPAFLTATGDTELHHEAVVEHDGAKDLIILIKHSTPSDEFFGRRIRLLSEMINDHVKVEEQPNGMFAKATASAMDLAALGRALDARKAQLTKSDPNARGHAE